MAGYQQNPTPSATTRGVPRRELKVSLLEFLCHVDLPPLNLSIGRPNPQRRAAHRALARDLP